MADALNALGNFINSPPGQLATGCVFAGIVWKLFERIDGVLKDDTKEQFARWLRVRSVEVGILASEAATLQSTFVKMFER